jgi:hypothetical protein
MRKSVEQIPFGSVEPFSSGDPGQVEAFYARLIVALERTPQIRVLRDPDHHGSGYASYISLFLSPRDGSSITEHPAYFETGGILLDLSRLAPIAVHGASSRTRNKRNPGSSSGLISMDNLGTLPGEKWAPFARIMKTCLRHCGIELLQREPLSLRAPDYLKIPTVFDGPHHVFDTLFYWED